MPDQKDQKKKVHINIQKLLQKRQFLIPALLVLVIIVCGIILVVQRYTPTKKRMSLSDYFTQSASDEVSVILNGAYMDPADTDEKKPLAVKRDDCIYLDLSFVREHLDDGYVWDGGEGILRYATDTQLITASLDSPSYQVDRDTAEADAPVVCTDDAGNVLLLADWLRNYTDFTSYTEEDPARIVIETAGWKHTTAALRRNTAVRRFGGVKSRILEDGEKGEDVIILDNYGKWLKVLTGRGVIGCVRSNAVKDRKDTSTAASLPARNYEHIKYDGKIVLAWQQVTSRQSNYRLAQNLANTSGVNVVCPTWYGLSDSAGNITDISDSGYVSSCHAAGIRVWALASNFMFGTVDTTTVLNSTSKRDNLVNSLVAAAISDNVDGINVDFEMVSADAADGYIQFIRELSLKCGKNDLVLSVDDYPPLASNQYYRRDIQADYADYVIVMGYDEHYAGSAEAGSVASIGFVKNAVQNTLEQVPADQLILGMPFYTRVWTTADGAVSSVAYGMNDAADYIASHGIQMTWNDEAGQNYGEYTDGTALCQIWNEDAQSLALKLAVVNDNGLAGGAFWKLGFEPASVWNLIDQYLK